MITFLVVIFGTLGPFAAPEFPPSLPAFTSSSTWHDGKAEVATYDSTRTVYGKTRRFETTAIVVKEKVGRFSRVKVDNPKAQEPTLDGAKLHLMQRFETENYPYHFAITVLVEREQPFRLIKQSVSSQEWCGTTFQQINHLGQAWKYWWDSYWEGEGHGQIILQTAPVTEEQLLLALRSVAWKADSRYRMPIIWGLHSTKARAGDPIDTEIHCQGQVQVETPAGTFTCWDIQVQAGNSRARFRVGTEAPFPLVEYQGSEGRTLKLKSLRRWAYWKR